ncbi:MAG: acyltransferase family protein [Blastocatellales bacterium]
MFFSPNQNPTSTESQFTPDIPQAIEKQAHPNSGTKYRPDIDGLRAIAVIPVVLFHAGFAGFHGGFVGVDVFFVISGFLITSLILPETLDGKFSIVTFYERRVRRIFPALFAVMFVCLIASYWLMWPLAFKDFGQSVVAATSFASNNLFWIKFGYFDSPADSRPLLHTWSLAVEEQFYIVFPLYLLMTVRWFSSALKQITIAIAVVSLGLSIYLVDSSPSSAFYLAPSRAWELLLGSSLAMGVIPPLKSKLARTALSLTGLVLIGWAVFTFSKMTHFPGLAALFPCVGTAMVIYAGGGDGNLINRLLSVRWLVFCGLISYSLYLWHWPLIVFGELYLLRGLRYAEATVVVLVSIPLAILSWKFIEQPFRTNRTVFTRRRLFTLAGVSMVITFVLGLSLHLTEGWPTRMSPRAQQLALGSTDCHRKPDRCNSPEPEDISSDKLCRIGDVAALNPDFVLWGDSHGEFLSNAISHAAALTRRSGYVVTSEGCPPIIGVHRLDKHYSRCPAISDATLKVISDPGIRQVVIIARWSLWSEGTRYRYENGSDVKLFDDGDPDGELSNREVLRMGLKRTLDALQLLHKQITVVAPIPEIGWDVPSVLALESWQGRHIHSEPTLSDFLARNQYALELLREFQSEYGFDLVYPHETLCNQKSCQVIRDQQPLYCDDDHLSKHGMSYLIPAFEQVLRPRIGSESSSLAKQ